VLALGLVFAGCDTSTNDGSFTLVVINQNAVDITEVAVGETMTVFAVDFYVTEVFWTGTDTIAPGTSKTYTVPKSTRNSFWVGVKFGTATDASGDEDGFWFFPDNLTKITATLSNTGSTASGVVGDLDCVAEYSR
jgi:hypothetical protein